MAIIVISRGSYTRGKEVAEKVARRMGYACISREVLIEASKEFDIPEIKLIQAFEEVPSMRNRLTFNKRKYVSYIQAAILRYLKEDNVIYHGFAGHFFVKDIPHVLKARIIAGFEDRVKIVMERDGLSRKAASRYLVKIDEQREKWSRKLYGMDPQDPSLYDIVLCVNRIRVNDAVDVLCRIAQLSPFQMNRETKGLMEDLALAAGVNTILVDVKEHVDVSAQDGFVYLKTGGALARQSELVEKMGEIMKKIPAAKGIKVVTEREPEDRHVRLSDAKVRSTKDVTSTFFSELG